MTLKKFAQLALDVQNACNLTGVVKSFSEATLFLWDEASDFNATLPKGSDHFRGTDWVNQHPICVLFAAQCAYLTSGIIWDFEAYSKATAACRDLAASE